MTAVGSSRQNEGLSGSPRRIAVVPVYDEEPTVVQVLAKLETLVDEIVVVDDGSRDRSRQLILAWAEQRPHVRTVLFDKNRGLSAAYAAAFRLIGRRLADGELRADDAVITVDADGQHEPRDLDLLVSRLYEKPCDAAIARRDLSGYSAFKRLGNWVLSLWASVWAGCRLYDVESGFRVFRAAPLVEALAYYHGYRYSETVEVAVVLARLGYRISNDTLVPVPVSRSRTRLSDGIIDALAIVGAWWRIVAGRGKPQAMPQWSIYVFPSLAVAGLAFISIDLLINPLFLASDSMHNYAHVWYISEQIFDNTKLPLHVALLDSGHAVTFPYAIGPYLLGAILFPLFGNWAVTLLMVVAILGIVYSAGLARPVMRDPWFILLFVLNPFFIDAIFGFQFASLWSAFFFFLFVWAFEKRRYIVAGALAWLTISSHPVLGAEALGVFGLWLLLFDRPRLRPLVLTGIPVAIALIPIYWMTLHTPAAGETSTGTLLYDVGDAFVRRGTIIAAPFALSAGAPYVRRFYPALMPLVAAGFALAMVFQSGVYRYPGAPSGYYGMIHRSSDMYAEFFRSPSFQPGGTYRLLEPGEREDGMYRFMQHGAVLSNEFFTESLHHQSWSQPQYQCYGAFKRIDFVVVERAYDRRAGTGERDLLNSLIAEGLAQRYYSDAKGRFDVYDIRPFVSQRQQPKSLRECGMA